MVTRYRYDEAGNEIAQIDALGRTNVFTYDNLGRRVLHTRPDTYSEGFTYDVAGNLRYQTNFDGNIITNRYDNMNRLTDRVQQRVGLMANYTYTVTGQRASSVLYDPTQGFNQFDCNYVYDNRDRLMRKMSTWNGGTGLGGTLAAALNYGYDANGNLMNLSSSMANGVSLAYHYDPLNRITNVLSHGQLTAAYFYDAVGNLQGMKYGNGVTNAYQFDALNRLTNLVWMTNGHTAASFYYQLGKTGNRTNLNEVVNQVSRSYSWVYDNLYRMTNETLGGSGGGAVGYQFDRVGNRTNRLSTITALPDAQYEYGTNDWVVGDAYYANGNTETAGGVSYTYDVENRLTGSGGKAFAYDTDGNRIAKTTDGNNSWTYYLVDDSNPTGSPQVLEEYYSSSSGAPMFLNRTYNYGLALISQQQFNTNTLLPSATSYYGFDGHGSVRFLTSTNQFITDAYVYDAYGTTIASTGSTLNNYLYCGEQFDPSLGMYYLRARYYKPDTGRFWTSDTFEGSEEVPLSLHKYLYCHANPIGNVDPSGRDIGEVMTSMDILTGLGGMLSPNFNLVQANTPGPDVTKALVATMIDVNQVWDKNGFFKDAIAMSRLITQRGYDKWDIGLLHTLGSINHWENMPRKERPDFGNGSRLGTGPIGRETVQFTYWTTDVYYASSVNYILWGRIFALAFDTFGDLSFSEPVAVALAKAHKFHIGASGSDYEKQAVAFVKLGYYGADPRKTALSGIRPDPKNVGSSARFAWRFLGLHDTME